MICPKSYKKSVAEKGFALGLSCKTLLRLDFKDGTFWYIKQLLLLKVGVLLQLPQLQANAICGG